MELGVVHCRWVGALWEQLSFVLAKRRSQSMMFRQPVLTSRKVYLKLRHYVQTSVRMLT